MDLGHLLLTLVEADGHGWIVLGTLNLWEQGTFPDANQPYTQKQQHCGGRWRICYNIRPVRAFGQTVRN
ncbi:unnamed protein product [Brassica rapa]|uniref:Uncharacterized protein n=1 Tax=Brassica campestris TaxID=3711 RepID=A0A3P6CFA4_BRACM|nr:unnamed protein product [Brassica rapa]VDD11674.1 unnamed protein product [Brassica rapa]